MQKIKKLLFGFTKAGKEEARLQASRLVDEKNHARIQRAYNAVYAPTGDGPRCKDAFQKALWKEFGL